jgi:hypothetical protein
MNRTAREIIMNRRRREDQRRGYDYARGGRGMVRRDYRDGHYYEDEEEDYRNRGRRDYGDYPDYNDYRDYRDYRMYGDFRDYADDMMLTKSDIKEWKSMLENADGTRGEHFEKRQILDSAEKVGVRYNRYDEDDLCITANALYSDYSDVLKMFVPQDKEAIVYTRLAKAFLEDPDASAKGKEKLAIYYNCIVKGDED